MNPTRRRLIVAALGLLALLILIIGIVWLVPRPELPPAEGRVLLSVEYGITRRWVVVDAASGAYENWGADGEPEIPAGSSDMQISPGGAQIAFPIFDAPSDTMRIYVVNRDGSGERPLSKGEGRDHSPAWSPDGTRIAFSRSRSYYSALFVIDVATGNETQITDFTNDIEADWSPDGAQLVFTTSRDGFQELYTYTFATGAFQRLTHNDRQNDLRARWSPDGAQIAYMSNYSVGDGTGEIWLMDADGGNQRRLTDNDQDDADPLWSPDGSMILFRRTTADRIGSDLWVYEVATEHFRQITDAREHEFGGVWSPDSRYIATIRSEDGSKRTSWLVRLADLERQPLFVETDVRVWFVSGWLPSGATTFANP